MANMRIGFGYDVHQLQEGRDLWLGGVQIPAEKGALGHSDADVILHALCDAILGAMNAGDIGKHFPDTDKSFKNIDSKILLQRVIEVMKSKDYHIVNVDCSLSLEKPKIAPHLEAMRAAIAPILEVSEEEVSIKATTGEKMGFVGRQEGLCAYAVVLLEKNH
ncbi:MAG: 2-C-methyl-D-erythritol 2,4-cyclodiphosphate synthase [Chitinophagales bacterium]|nr:2-C-methyl-D-erythritol 2,4-cyclodiphosphate synthase [Chitinophagales bacterium]